MQNFVTWGVPIGEEILLLFQMIWRILQDFTPMKRHLLQLRAMEQLLHGAMIHLGEIHQEYQQN